MDTLVKFQNLAALSPFLTTLPSLVNELFTRFIPLSGPIQAKNTGLYSQEHATVIITGIEPITPPFGNAACLPDNIIYSFSILKKTTFVASLSGEYRIRTDDP